MRELPDVVAKRLASAVPDVAGVAQLAAVEADLSADGAWEAYAALERQIAWLQARQAKLLAVAQTTVPQPAGSDDRDWAEVELAAMLAISPYAAAGRLDVARRLPQRTRAYDLLARGDISLAHVTALLDETVALDAERVTMIDELVLADAPGRTPATFRKRVRRAVLAAMSRGEQAELIEQRLRERSVTSYLHRDGILGTLRADLPIGDIAAIMRTLTAAARAADAADDDRSIDQKRADALTQAVVSAGEHGMKLATEQRHKPAVQLVVALSTLLGMDNQPGELDGHPIPAELAVRIASDPSGTWRRLVTDAVGNVVDYGRATYRPPSDLADHVIARDRTCVWANCNQPARRCDLDHRKRWTDGGHTAADNLQALCVGHHHFKEEGWRCELLSDGSIRWTSPTGRTYIRPPATYPRDNTGGQTAA